MAKKASFPVLEITVLGRLSAPLPADGVGFFLCSGLGYFFSVEMLMNDSCGVVHHVFCEGRSGEFSANSVPPLF
ncbi:hypothetical protein L1987_45268 [Smallanthus sonchifolius]|uniref:Uncharacterized protein n=1 Tax=Smallanthus sonchifolius TaxID=185202 RepID=A0ACB9GRV1_9ASTR|nr:hypothetical protein L1987_45268 [Smallanthus sonchifolius]